MAVDAVPPVLSQNAEARTQLEPLFFMYTVEPSSILSLVDTSTVPST